MALTKVDYTTFTKVDPNSHLTVTASHLDFDAYKNEDCYLYKDYGPGFFHDFEHKVDVKGVSGSSSLSIGGFWLLTNAVDDIRGLQIANKTFIGLWIYFYVNTPYIYLQEYYNNFAYIDTFKGVIDTSYYLTITKSGTALTCKIYSDSARTNLLKTVSLTLHTDHIFHYLFGANTYNMGITPVCTLDIDNLSVAIPLTQCNAPTSHFATGCELLLHYDPDHNGLISLNALTQSYFDYEDGIITQEEFDFVSDAYINEGINVVCPGCGTPQSKKIVTFESAPTGAVVTVE